MESGLYILAIRAGYSPYVIVGAVERHDFLLRVAKSRVIRRFGQNQQLASLAKNGPKTGVNPTQLLDISPEEWIPLCSVARAIPASESAWATYLV